MRNGKGCATAQTRQVSHRVSPSHALFFLRQLLSISACYTGYPRGNDRKPSVFLEINSTGDAGSSLLIRGCLIVSAQYYWQRLINLNYFYYPTILAPNKSALCRIASLVFSFDFLKKTFCPWFCTFISHQGTKYNYHHPQCFHVVLLNCNLFVPSSNVVEYTEQKSVLNANLRTQLVRIVQILCRLSHQSTFIIPIEYFSAK